MKKIKILLYFPANEVEKPFTYHLIKDYDLKINILSAEISLNKQGRLIADVSGTEENIKKGLEFLKQHNITVKLFNKSIIWQENKCVHCGVCTAVCPSEALSMDKDTWTLTFDKEKCLICELCIRSCPLNAINISV